jgi:hypothetical protein
VETHQAIGRLLMSAHDYKQHESLGVGLFSSALPGATKNQKDFLPVIKGERRVITGGVCVRAARMKWMDVGVKYWVGC